MHEGIPHSDESSPAAFRAFELEALGAHESEPAREALAAVLGSLTTPAAERGAEFEIEGETAERVVRYGDQEVTITYVLDDEGNPKLLIGAKLAGEQGLEINAAEFK